MDIHEMGWVAGFYEGEGCFAVNHNRYGHPNAVRLTIAQRNEEPLLWVLDVVGIGKVTHRLIRGKDFWNYDAGKSLNALYIAEQLWPYLSERRQDQIIVKVDEFLSVRRVIDYSDAVAFLKEEVKAPRLHDAQVREMHRRAL